MCQISEQDCKVATMGCKIHREIGNSSPKTQTQNETFAAPQFRKKLQKPSKIKRTFRVFNGATHRKLKTLSCGGVSNVLGSNVANAPEEAGADDLSLQWVMREAALVPFPHLKHHLNPKPPYGSLRDRWGKRFRSLEVMDLWL